MSEPATPAQVTALSAAKAVQSSDAGNPALGIAYMVIAVALFTIMDALVKWLGPHYPTMQIVFFRSLFAFVPLGIFIARTGSLVSLATRQPFGHVLRSFIGLTALSCFFYAYAHMPLANVIAIAFAAPLFITALSVPLLGEAVGPRRWGAVAFGFVGVIIMVRPDSGVFDSVALVALFGTVCYALAMIFVRKLSRTETSAAIVFYYSLASTIVAGLFMPFQWVTPGLQDLGLLIAVGLVGGVAQIFMTNAFRNAPAAVIAPFDYTTMIWAVIVGFFIWGEIPGVNVWIGVAIVVVSGLYILQREANLGLRRGVARPLQPRR